MRWWNLSLFGERVVNADPPASPAAKRCLAIRWSRDVWIVRCWLGGGVIGVLLFVGCMILVSRFGTAIAAGSAAHADVGIQSFVRDVPQMLMRHGDTALWLLGPPAVLLLVLPWITRRMYENVLAGLTRTDLVRLREKRRLAWRTLAALAAVFLALPVLLGVSIGMGPMILFLALYGLVAGSAAVLRGVTGRDGRGLACGRCGYSMRSWRAAPPQCTECGHAWRRMWGQTIGQRSLSVGWVGAGAVVLLASLIAAIVAMAGIE